MPEITRELVAHGQPAEMPTAVIERGTTPQQRVLVGTLGTISRQVLEQGFKSPCLIIIGEVVKLRGSLKWFETSPAV